MQRQTLWTHLADVEIVVVVTVVVVVVVCCREYCCCCCVCGFAKRPRYQYRCRHRGHGSWRLPPRVRWGRPERTQCRDASVVTHGRVLIVTLQVQAFPSWVTVEVDEQACQHGSLPGLAPNLSKCRRGSKTTSEDTDKVAIDLPVSSPALELSILTQRPTQHARVCRHRPPCVQC